MLREKKRRRSLRRMVCIPGFEKEESFPLRDDGRFLVYTTWEVTGLLALSCRLFAPSPSRRKAAVSWEERVEMECRECCHRGLDKGLSLVAFFPATVFRLGLQGWGGWGAGANLL